RYKPIALGSSSLLSEAVRKEDFKNLSKRVIFIRNLPSTQEDSLGSNDTIVMKSRIRAYTLKRSLISFVHLGPKPFRPLLDKNSGVDGEEMRKSIFVVPLDIPYREEY